MTDIQVDANPTKEFFISMLTRDIPLDRAILDLIDNSVDAANASGDVSDKIIRLTMNSTEFCIEDNCGGFDIETAKKYAFRFGRDSSQARLTPNTVGQFGVGMKRTLFKLGGVFSVKSIFNEGAFSLNVNVNEWLADSSEKWAFSLSELERNEDDISGTYIKAEQLTPSISEQFTDNEFLRTFKDEVSKAYFRSISRGLKIIINEKDTNKFDIGVRTSDELGVVCLEQEYNGVKITVRSGVDEQSYPEGGWYIVCNERLVESAEQTAKTLWGTNSIPKYHDRLAFFRGVVEFEAEDSSKLPWTTTKTGVDTDNPIYRFANKMMIKALEPIVKFLNQRESERKQVNDNRLDEDQRVLELSIRNATPVSIYNIDASSEQFIHPEKIEARAASQVTITYQMDVAKLNQVKDSLGVTSASEVGKETFSYYYSYECE